VTSSDGGIAAVLYGMVSCSKLEVVGNHRAVDFGKSDPPESKGSSELLAVVEIRGLDLG
jgi:hypothetical protein